MRNNFGLGVGSFAPAKWNLGIPFFKRALRFGSGGSGGFFLVKHREVGFTQNRAGFPPPAFLWLLPGGVQLGRKWSQKTQGNGGCSDGRREISVCWKLTAGWFFLPQLTSSFVFFWGAKKYISQSFTGKHTQLSSSDDMWHVTCDHGWLLAQALKMKSLHSWMQSCYGMMLRSTHPFPIFLGLSPTNSL